jgi:uncharacterized protein YceH (UPF0502 family)
MEPDAVEIRVLGCLLEKQRTTPDAYPLTLNGVRLAANQSTNRDPVVDYDEVTVRDALHRLGRRGWARLASGHSSRAVKYRHLLDGALDLAPHELAVLCVLMLRGPQTPGELKQRTERIHAFGDLWGVQATLGRLADRNLVRSLGRRPGQKEERWVQLLAGEEEGEAAVGAAAARAAPDALAAQLEQAEPTAESAAAPAGAPAGQAGQSGVFAAPAGPPEAAGVLPTEAGDRLAALEHEVAALRDELEALRRELGI